MDHLSFYDTFRYLDDIFTIDNNEFTKHIPDKYQMKLQLNKANYSDKEASLIDLNTKVIDSDVYAAFTTIAITSDFLFQMLPGWAMMFLDSQKAVELAFWISNLKIFKSLPNCLHI